MNSKFNPKVAYKVIPWRKKNIYLVRKKCALGLDLGTVFLKTNLPASKEHIFVVA